MIYSANLIYLTMWIRFEEFFDGARTCARAARAYSSSYEMLFLKDFYIGQLYERAARAQVRARQYSARQEISTNK